MHKLNKIFGVAPGITSKKGNLLKSVSRLEVYIYV